MCVLSYTKQFFFVCVYACAFAHSCVCILGGKSEVDI